MENELRQRNGRPQLYDFGASQGTPIAIDIDTGRLYILRSDNTVVDCLLLSPTGPWDDLRFPAQGINPQGAAAAPTVDIDLTKFPGTLLFSGTAINLIAGVAQMPHAWELGTEVHPHIHWAKTVSAAGAVGWQFSWRKATAGAAFSAWSAWGDGVSAAVNGAEATADTHYITTFPAIPMLTEKESTLISWQVRRLGNTDPLNDPVRLFEFNIHYQKSSLGSILEFPV